MENTILKQVNAYGAELGWPFYVYPDGTCGKRMVSADGGLNAVMVVKKKFPVNELKSAFLTGTAGDNEDVLAHLCEIGDNSGYPLYVYADGSCGTTPVSQENKFPFTLVLKKKICVNQMVLEPEGETSSPAVGKKWKPKPFPQWIITPEQKEILAKARKRMKEKRPLLRNEEKIFVAFAEDEELKDFLRSGWIADEEQKTLIGRGNPELVNEFIARYCFGNEVEPLLADYYDDDVILAYAKSHPLGDELIKKLLENGRFGLIEKIQEVRSILIRVVLEAGHPELLKTEIRKRGRWSCGDLELLLKSGNEEMIIYYLDYYKLYLSSLQKTLVEFCSAKVVQIYQERYGFYDDAYKLAKWRGKL